MSEPRRCRHCGREGERVGRGFAVRLVLGHMITLEGIWCEDCLKIASTCPMTITEKTLTLEMDAITLEEAERQLAEAKP